MTQSQTDFVDYLRTLALGQHEENDRIEERLDATGWIGYPRFIATAFFLAVDRHFTQPADAGEIIRFVAAIRSQVPPDGPTVDQDLAEKLIRSVLDDSVTVDRSATDPEMVGKIQSLVVYHILTEGMKNEDELNAFLAEVARSATR